MKNLSLYHLKGEYFHLIENLYDQETGEINEDINNQLSKLFPCVQDKCIAIANYLKKTESDKREIELLKNEILIREAAYTKEINRWKDYLLTNMVQLGISEVNCPYFKLKVKINPYSTHVFDENSIPKEFMKTTVIERTETKPDKVAIKEYFFATGIQVEGTYVEQTKKLEMLFDKI